MLAVRHDDDMMIIGCLNLKILASFLCLMAYQLLIGYLNLEILVSFLCLMAYQPSWIF